MKIFKITNDYLINQINKSSGNWDDIMNIPDIAENFTDDKKEKYNPLCYNFWIYNFKNTYNKTSFDKNFHNIAEIYKNFSSI